MNAPTFDRIREAVTTHPQVAAWTISASRTKSTELFFVRDRLDMNRSAEVCEYTMRVLVDFTERGVKYRGEAVVRVGAADDDASIRKKIKDAVFSARFVKNKWYDLPEREDTDALIRPACDNLDELKKKYKQVQKALFRDYPYDARVNSCEVFAVNGEKRLVTSKGVDISYPYSEFTFELVTDSDAGEEPVEIFNGYTLPKVDIKEIERIVDKQLMETDGRSRAVRNETLHNQRLILTGDAVEEFLYFYLDEASDARIYQQVSRAQRGKRYLPTDAAEKLNIRIQPALATSVYSVPVDRDGKILSRYTLYQNGVVKELRTTARFSHYMDIPHIGNCSTFEVSGGKNPLSDYLDGDYVEVLSFSAFLVDGETGDFGGEFRLAKQVRGGKTRFITGGSVSECILNVQDRMRFSREREARKHSLIPKAIIIDGVTIAGE